MASVSIRHPVSFWVIVAFLAVSVVLMLTGQTMALLDYDLAVRLGLQESAEQIGEYGVQVNRAFGGSDTLVYVPLLVLALVGLLLGKRWALVATAAAFGISAYWSATIAFMMVFLGGVPGYSLVFGPPYWLVLGSYALAGVWGLVFLILRGDTLLSPR